MARSRRKRQTRGRTVSRLCLLSVVVGTLGARAVAVPKTLTAAVPAEAAAAWFVDRQKPAAQRSALDRLGVARFVVDQAGEFGLLSQVDPVSRAWIDTLAALSVLLEHPHAVALFQVRARRLQDGGHRLAALYGAVIIHTRGEHRAVEQRIQRLLNTYTNQDESDLTTRTLAGGTVFELRDRRMPDWAVINWGATGDYYLVTIGEGSFQRVADTIAGRGESLGQDDWFDRAFSTNGGNEAWLAVWADFTLLRGTSDIGLAEKVTRVRDTLGLREIDRGLWTVRFEDRAVQAVGYVSRDGHDQTRPLTATTLAGFDAATLIPEKAGGYAIFDVTPRQVLGLVRETYMSARSEQSRRRIEQYWRELQSSSGLSIEPEIFGRLGQGVIVHDYPPHALGLPLLWTIVTPIRGDPDGLRAALDRLCQAWRDQLCELEAPVGLRREPDGIWYLHLGISGPAIGLNDQWLVISFSPEAVRENLRTLPNGRSPRLAGPTEAVRE